LIGVFGLTEGGLGVSVCFLDLASLLAANFLARALAFNSLIFVAEGGSGSSLTLTVSFSRFI